MVRVFGIQSSRRQAAIFLADLTVLAVVILLSVFLRTGADSYLKYLNEHMVHFLVLVFIFIITFQIADLYDIKRNFRHASQQLYLYAVCFISMMISVSMYYSGLTSVGRSILFLIGVLVPLSIGLVRSLYESIGSVEQWKRKVLIVGAGGAGKRLHDTINNFENCDLCVIGFVDDDPEKQGTLISGKPVMGGSQDLVELALKNKVHMIVLGVISNKSNILVKNLIRCYYMHIAVLDMPTVYESITGKLPLKYITEEWLLNNAMLTHRLRYKNLKRSLDILFSLILLLLSTPLTLLAVILIKFESKGEVLFRQRRVGMDFKEFTIYKFRTMVQNAEKDTGAVWASENDMRITKAGKFLRRFRIDEIPQLINVIGGQMSFVGPRPERKVFIDDFEKEITAYGYRLIVKPGITGWAQVKYKYTNTKEQTIEKLKYDLYYIKNMSLLLDILIVLKTVKTVFTFGSEALHEDSREAESGDKAVV